MLKRYFPYIVSLLFFGSIIAFIGWALVSNQNRVDDFAQRCEAAGGLFTDGRKNDFCFTPDGQYLGYL